MQPLLLLILVGLAFLDSLDVLLVGVVTAVVYDSRLNRRSPLPGGLSFLGGVFTATTAFGIFTVLGIYFLSELVDFELTPTPRYWGGFALGVILILLARPVWIPHQGKSGCQLLARSCRIASVTGSIDCERT